MSKSNATHTWIADGIALDVCCNGGNVYLPTDDQADPSVQPKATYDVADYDEEGNEELIVLVGGRATTGKLVPIRSDTEAREEEDFDRRVEETLDARANADMDDLNTEIAKDLGVA